MTELDVDIRPERRDDIATIRAVNDAAFGGQAESRIVDAARVAGHVDISLVAVAGQEIVGHILFTPIRIEPPRVRARVLGLGPMAVRPSLQRRGIGSALVRAGLDAARRRGCDAIVVIGHPAFYPRFGFQRASRFGLTSEFPAPDEAFMAAELTPGALEGAAGLVRYGPEFDES